MTLDGRCGITAIVTMNMLQMTGITRTVVGASSGSGILEPGFVVASGRRHWAGGEDARLSIDFAGEKGAPQARARLRRAEIWAYRVRTPTWLDWNNGRERKSRQMVWL